MSFHAADTLFWSTVDQEQCELWSPHLHQYFAKDLQIVQCTYLILFQLFILSFKHRHQYWEHIVLQCHTGVTRIFEARRSWGWHIWPRCHTPTV